MNRAMNEAKIRRPHCALFDSTTANRLKLMRSIRTKEERIFELLGELEEMLEGPDV